MGCLSVCQSGRLSVAVQSMRRFVRSKISNKQPFVTYVPLACFDLYKIIIREMHTKAYKYSKFGQIFACVVKYNIIH